MYTCTRPLCTWSTEKKIIIVIILYNIIIQYVLIVVLNIKLYIKHAYACVYSSCVLCILAIEMYKLYVFTYTEHLILLIVAILVLGKFWCFLPFVHSYICSTSPRNSLRVFLTLSSDYSLCNCKSTSIFCHIAIVGSIVEHCCYFVLHQHNLVYLTDYL